MREQALTSADDAAAESAVTAHGAVFKPHGAGHASLMPEGALTSAEDAAGAAGI